MKRSLQVKVCGVTTSQGLESCLALGVDFVGFNFVPGTPRCLDTDRAEAFCDQARGRATTVGVFRDATLQEVRKILAKVPLDAVQLHGNEPPEWVEELPVPVWKVFHVGPGWDTSGPSRYHGLAVHLFDTKVGKTSGGAGKAFDWGLLPSNPPRPWFLAGGLSPENLSRAVLMRNPDGVDLNSGVESAPGIKDPVLLKAAMDVLEPWRPAEIRRGRPSGIPGGSFGHIELEGGQHWACWTLPQAPLSEEQEYLTAMVLLERNGRLVLDYSARREGTVETISEFMRLQMEATSHGWKLRFRLSESLLRAMGKASLLVMLDILD